MYYRAIEVNTRTGKRAVMYTRFTSRKKAFDYAEKFEAAIPSAKVEIYKEDMQTRIR